MIYRPLGRLGLLAMAASSEDDAAIGASLGHLPGDISADWRVVDRRIAERPAIVDGVPEPAERPDQVLLQRESGVIRTDGDEHRMGLYSREKHSRCQRHD